MSTTNKIVNFITEGKITEYNPIRNAIWSYYDDPDVFRSYFYYDKASITLENFKSLIKDSLEILRPALGFNYKTSMKSFSDYIHYYATMSDNYIKFIIYFNNVYEIEIIYNYDDTLLININREDKHFTIYEKDNIMPLINFIGTTIAVPDILNTLLLEIYRTVK